MNEMRKVHAYINANLYYIEVYVPILMKRAHKSNSIVYVTPRWQMLTFHYEICFCGQGIQSLVCALHVQNISNGTNHISSD